jgi:hypothetical protein
MVVGYVLVMSALAAGLLILRRTGGTATPGASREPGTAASPAGTGAAAPSGRGWLRLIRHLVTTSAGGYLTLMAVLIAYYYGVMRVGGNFIESAFTGCALLLGLSCPVFLAASWLTERWHQHKATRGPHPRRVRIGRRHA